MKTKILALLSLMYVTSNGLFAQNEVDALRYSYNQYGGTARFVSMGGAFSTLGGEFTSLGINPAGVGIYKKSEFTFTPGFYSARTNSNYNNNLSEEAKYNINMNNIGLVLTYNNQYAEEGWINGSVFMGINKINNFNSRSLMQGNSDGSSLLTDYWEKSENIKVDELDPFSTALAYDTKLIQKISNENNYGTVLPNGGAFQSKLLTTKGYHNEMVIGGGGNYSDVFYIGAALGVPFIKYNETSTYSETDKSDTISGFKSFNVDDNLTTTGSGVNLKIGLIYRPIDFVRLGVGFQTPTFYALTDKYDKKIVSNFDDGSTYEASSPKGEFEYTLTTPFKANAGISFIIGKFGLVSADYEFTDYSEARLRASDYSFISENNNMQLKYTSNSNLRLGAEARINDNVAIRGGYAMYGSPYKSNINDASKTVISGGLGFRQENLFLDLSYSLTQWKEKYYFFNPDLVNPTKNTTKAHSFLVTIGYKFY